MLVYDGNCGFCARWVDRIRAAAGDRVSYAPSQEVGHRFPQISPEQFENAVQWIGPDGEVYSGARAALFALAFTGPAGKLLWWAYSRLPWFAGAAEAAYRFVAHNRKTASTVSRWLWGQDLRRPTYRTSADLFLRGLAVIYLIAFLSFWVQAHGLIGAQGILPIEESLRLAAEKGHPLRYPTLFWFDQSDTFIHVLCGAGTLLAGVAAIVPACGLFFLLLWIGYLSIVTTGGPFFSFQWDVLLLEAGLLAVFLAPWGLPTGRGAITPSRLVAWLYRWLLFRFMFASGVVKLTSGDATWRDLSALTYHYQTQPLPNPLAWYAHYLPDGIHVVSAGIMFAIELAAPFFIFAPRRPRIAACALLVGLQAGIALTGNYTFFNLLATALCLWLVDDATWPKRLRTPICRERRYAGSIQGLAAVPLAAVVVMLSLVYLCTFSLRLKVPWPRGVDALNRAVAPYNVVNTYGLFQVMTTRRPEIILEGSRDGETWLPYEFRCKPGDPERRPPVVAPHQPRLDWQMWFAALGHYRQSPWMVRLCRRLLEGSPPVTGLLARNPFPGSPPRYLRGQLYDYRFTTPEERRRTGDWWNRAYRKTYLPKIQLE
ncbi:MAG: lipase maturation factor family protein [Gemmatimonadota bacterium]|nr:lipase maturation factor family protein [Gemmatimonadota bacterium]